MASAKQLLTHAIHKLSEEECGVILDSSGLEFLNGPQTLHWEGGSLRNEQDQRVNVGIGGITQVAFAAKESKVTRGAKPNGLDSTQAPAQVQVPLGGAKI